MFFVPGSISSYAYGEVSSERRSQEGEYGGVTPEAMDLKKMLPHGRPRFRNNKKNALYWVGIVSTSLQPTSPGQVMVTGPQAENSGLFLQLSREAEILQTVDKKNSRLTISLPNIRPVRRNLRRHMDLRHFSGPILRVKTAVRRRKDSEGRWGSFSEIYIDWKPGYSARPAQIRTQVSEDGFVYIFLQFSQ